MIKKVSVQDLKLGMFIHDLNCGWMDHDFLRSRFMLRKEEDLRKLQAKGSREVFIDTVRGIDIDHAPTVEEVNTSLENRIHEIAARSQALPAKTSHAEELSIAKDIQNEASQVVTGLMTDIRLGKQIEAERVSPVVTQITESILRNPGTLMSLCRLKEGDTYTFQHCVSIATLLVAFCRYMDMDKEQLIEAGIGGMLHDVGKMRVPDHILNKPGKLTEDEFAIMKGHVTLGLETLQQTPSISPMMIQIAGEHHERFDGTGYPNGLKGDQISQVGRMSSLVDVYDAITSNRVYHRGMEPAIALKKMFEWSEYHFDPVLTQHFIQAIGIYPVGSLVRLESQRIGIVVEQGEKGLLFPVVRLIFDVRRRVRLQPKDIDLSHSGHGGDHIIGSEEPGDWNINPFDYLTLEIGA
ncbi:MAG: HD-GYP domain-containing protein [Firmicutes bacterium]|nr:HD-GYP domain-containing protein [Bacillota bacterium]